MECKVPLSLDGMPHPNTSCSTRVLKWVFHRSQLLPSDTVISLQISQIMLERQL